MKLVKSILKDILIITIDVIILFGVKMAMPVDDSNNNNNNNSNVKAKSDYVCTNQV